jgi:hypothetical protein
MAVNIQINRHQIQNPEIIIVAETRTRGNIYVYINKTEKYIIF